jgi:periplasmic divalent cation tolerance protein
MAPNNKPVLIYSTCPDENVAKEIARLLVDQRLAACVNIIPGMQAVYRWQGEVMSEREVVLLVKTTEQAGAAALAALVDAHPYETPAALLLPATGGSESYLKWISDMTDTATSGQAGG